MRNMVQIIIPESAHAVVNHPCRFVADRAIRRIHDLLRRILDQLHRSLFRAPVQHRIQQLCQLTQPYPAGRTLATALRVA